MNERVSIHYGTNDGLIGKIASGLEQAGKDIGSLTTADLASIDEFHFRGRKATLELAEKMALDESSRVIDIGSGLGGAARALAETYGCHVTGVDLTEAFCEAASVLSEWVGLSDRTAFLLGDATDLPFPDDCFDSAMSIHAAMNIVDKQALLDEAHRVLRPGGILAVYDIVQGEGGEALYPAPWAQEASISHLVDTREMERLLEVAGFKLLDVNDSSEESLDWLESRPIKADASASVPVTTQLLFGDAFLEMVTNQTIGLRERRIRTVSFICKT